MTTIDVIKCYLPSSNAQTRVCLYIYIYPDAPLHRSQQPLLLQSKYNDVIKKLIYNEQCLFADAATPYYAHTTLCYNSRTSIHNDTVYQPRNRYSYISKRYSFRDQEKTLAIMHHGEKRHVDGLTCSVWGRVLFIEV